MGVFGSSAPDKDRRGVDDSVCCVDCVCGRWGECLGVDTCGDGTLGGVAAMTDFGKGIILPLPGVIRSRDGVGGGKAMC